MKNMRENLELIPIADWRNLLTLPKTSIRRTLEIIDASVCQIILVTDEETHLLGTVTDGDIRRGILRGISLEEPVERIMKASPVTVKSDDSPEEKLAKVISRHIWQLPILDLQNRVVGMEVLRESQEPAERGNWVVIMAGGLGSRLRPLTNKCPKPLLKVGTKPILETILENFISHGFRKFFFSICYMDKMLKDYFGDGSRWNVEITYIREESGLGTAGALGLLEKKPKEPLIVMNGDLLTKINFRQLLDFHHEQKAKATMCIREYDFQVPYGVVALREHNILKIDEKPIHRFFVNAGIYVLDPSVLKYIPKKTTFDMPHLFDKLLHLDLNVTAFPIREYWLDIGRMDDLEQANVDFFRVFK